MRDRLPFDRPIRSSESRMLWWRECRALVKLAAPLALSQIAYMAIVTTDVVLMGWLGQEFLAAGTLAGHFYSFLSFFALGVLTAVAPILAQHLGARRFRVIRRTVRQGFWLAVLLAIPCAAIIWNTQAILVLLGQDSDLAGAGQSYLRVMIFGMLPGLWHLVLSEFLAAHSRPRAILVVTILGIFLNFALDYALMFGHFGFPRLELVGAGVASAIVNTVMFLSLLGFILTDRRLKRYRLLGRFWSVDWPRLFEIVRLGIPIAVTEVTEMGMFFASSLLMGLIGTSALAAHAVAGQTYAVVFMVPVGIAQAAAVRVGRAAGSRDAAGVARAGWVAISVSAGYAILPATMFWFFGGTIASLFLNPQLPDNMTTIALAVSFLAIAALFQFADAIGIVARGALMGLKDTRGPMLIVLVGYWGMGLPIAAFFGFGLDFGGQGIWAGLAVALFVVGGLLIWRFWAQTRRFDGTVASPQ